MALKFFKYVLPVGMGLLLCSCSTFRDEEYENFIKSEKEKIRNEYTLLEKQKQENQSEQMALTRQKEQLKKEYQLLFQEKERVKQEKITLSELKKQLDSEKNTQKPTKTKDDCLWPLNKDGTCMNGWNDIRKIPCKPGYFNILKEGWGGAIGNVSYEEVVNWVCHACSKGYYCPGDGYKYDCPEAEKTGTTECPPKKGKVEQEKITLSQLKKQLDSEKKQHEINYENRSCHNQKDCGGVNSGYFCNSNGHHTPNKCEKTNVETITLNGQEFYYNKLSNLKSWCREAFESQEDRNNPGNCNWGYLSYDAANAWCSSIGKRLVNAKEIEQSCSQFSFLPKANPDQQYWTENLSVVHMGQECSIQKMIRGDGYAWAGGVICK